MKLLVFSDSHGMPLYMRETLEKRRDVDAVIFLGDGQNDFQMMRALFPNIAFYSVRGNCDLGCADVPVREILDLDGAKIFCTHGAPLPCEIRALYRCVRRKGGGCESFAVRPHARGARELRRRTVYLKSRLLLGLSRNLWVG